MSNELIDAARSDSEDETSEDRYEKVKQEEAGTDMDPAEKRYDELKEKAKEEFIREKRKQEEKKSEEQDEKDIEEQIEEEKKDGFVTY